MRCKGVREARNQLSSLLDAAEKGRSTIITKHGRPVAALVPMEAYGAAVRQEPLLPVAGSGQGLWGKDSARTINTHAAGRVRFSVTIITIAEILTGPLQAGDEALARRYRAILDS